MNKSVDYTSVRVYADSADRAETLQCVWVFDNNVEDQVSYFIKTYPYAKIVIERKSQLVPETVPKISDSDSDTSSECCYKSEYSDTDSESETLSQPKKLNIHITY
jgi:hypothetical protein